VIGLSLLLVQRQAREGGVDVLIRVVIARKHRYVSECRFSPPKKRKKRKRHSQIRPCSQARVVMNKEMIEMEY